MEIKFHPSENGIDGHITFIYKNPKDGDRLFNIAKKYGYVSIDGGVINDNSIYNNHIIVVFKKVN